MSTPGSGLGIDPDESPQSRSEAFRRRVGIPATIPCLHETQFWKPKSAQA